jgi:hypothetical protein
MTKHVRVTKHTCGCEAYPLCEHASNAVKTETPQANPLLCCLESAAIRAGFNTVLVGQSIMLRNLAVVLREDSAMCLEIEKRMVRVLNKQAEGKPTGRKFNIAGLTVGEVY